MIPQDRDVVRYGYMRDDVRRRIRITVRQTLRPEDTVEIIDRQVRENAWVYPMLYDLRAIHADTPKAEVGALADYVREKVALHGARGPVAVVTRQIEMIAMARMYEAWVGFRVEVFWDIDEAERWLADPSRSR